MLLVIRGRIKKTIYILRNLQIGPIRVSDYIQLDVLVRYKRSHS
jgi:hypothetical protein